jgi:hypothetical protein
MMKRFYQIITIALLAVAAASCKKDDILPQAGLLPEANTAPLDTTATYKIILTGIWKMPELTVPAGNHFTQFDGMVHNTASYIFHAGGLASLGVENVAEVGANAELLKELNNAINNGRALNRFSLSLPAITSSDSAVIMLKSNFSLISFESMIAPSPDWFAGLDSYDLIQNGQWVKDITINIYGYDAGTEDGDIFGYSNPASNPQQNIRLLTPAGASVIANGNPVVAPFATLRIIRQ